MGKDPPKGLVKSACPPCRRKNRRCVKNSPKERCLKCNHQLFAGRNDTAAVIRWSPLFPEQEIELHLREHGWRNIPASSNNHTVVHLEIKSTALASDIKGPDKSRSCEINVEFRGLLNWDNVDLDSLDAAVYKHFSAKLKDKSKDSSPVRNAALVGGYLHLLCAADPICVPNPITTAQIDRSSQQSEAELVLTFRHIYIWRIRQLIDSIMYTIRQDYTGSDVNSKERIAYAAVSILQAEVSHFIAALKHGPLSSQVPVGLKGYFLDWIISLEIELQERLVEGCGRLHDWQSVVHGSMKTMRRKTAILTIHISVQQSEINIHIPPQFDTEDQPEHVHYLGSNIDTSVNHESNTDSGVAGRSSTQTNQYNFDLAPSLASAAAGELFQYPTPELTFGDLLSPYDYEASSLPLPEQIQSHIDPVLYKSPQDTNLLESFDFETPPHFFESLKEYDQPPLPSASDLVVDDMFTSYNVDLSLLDPHFFCSSNDTISHPTTVLEK